MELTEQEQGFLRVQLQKLIRAYEYVINEYDEGGHVTITWEDGIEGTRNRLAMTKSILNKLEGAK